jgi:hypothetical protein
MSTFYSTSEHMLAAVAELVDQADGKVDVHTISLELNGQHGEFDLRVLATDDDMEPVEFEAIAHRGGGLTDIREVHRA